MIYKDVFITVIIVAWKLIRKYKYIKTKAMIISRSPVRCKLQIDGRIVLLSVEPWAATKKSFRLVWRCHQHLSGFLAKGHLPRYRVSHGGR